MSKYRPFHIPFTQAKISIGEIQREPIPMTFLCTEAKWNEELLGSNHLFLRSGFARRDRFSMLVCFSVCFQQFSAAFKMVLECLEFAVIHNKRKSRHTPVLPRVTVSKPIYRCVMHHNSMTVNCETREQTFCNQYNGQHSMAIVISSLTNVLGPFRSYCNHGIFAKLNLAEFLMLMRLGAKSQKYVDLKAVN